jgi:hypothetical protein
MSLRKPGNHEGPLGESLSSIPGFYIPARRDSSLCLRVSVVVAMLTTLCGCQRVLNAPMPPMTPPVVEFGPPVAAYNPPQMIPTVVTAAVPNPILVPVTDHDAAWDGIVDVVDDYFKIEREDRVHVVGDYLNEGQIETYYQTGATLFEPWRGDSANAYERLESTLQSIRRKALVRVIPDASGYQVDVTVLKELEDVERPMYATTGAAVFRYDNSVDRNTEPESALARQVGDQARPVANPRDTKGWIGLGRDAALEQELLLKIQDRLTHGPLIARPAPAPVTPGQTVPIFGPPVVSDVGLPPSNP